MRKLLFLICIFCAFKANAQNYLISFAGTGASASVSTVKVENLMKGTTLTVNGSDILRLTAATGINSIDYNQSSELKFYPNPMTDNSTMEIYPPEAGNAVISVLDMTGKQVAQVQSYLEDSRQDFRLSGLKNGFYLIIVKGNGYRFSGKLLSNGRSDGIIKIEKVNNIIQSVDEKAANVDSKGTQATVDMSYTTGDRLKFTGISGIYSTMVTDIPVSDKTITLNFMACTDGDNNNYPVVGIGTQVWMAENLKTTKYNDGTSSIPNIIETAIWKDLITPAYCWYNNNEATYKATYGALYNWYTVNTENLCPAGWHVPNYDEWAMLITYLGGGSVAGGKLKETGTIHWQSPNTGATNESGFSALPGGGRTSVGFTDPFSRGSWWSSTEAAYPGYACGRYMFYNGSDINETIGMNGKLFGFSVRCVRNF